MYIHEWLNYNNNGINKNVGFGFASSPPGSNLGNPDHPLITLLYKSLLEVVDVLQSYMGGVISPACPGSVSGCPPAWTHVILLPREMYRRHPDQMPELF